MARQTNDKVRAARTALARELGHERNAHVHFLEIPGNGANKKTGVDDLLASMGPDKVLKLIDRAKSAATKEKRSLTIETLWDGVEFFHTQDAKPYSTFPVNDHRETWPVRSQGFRSWLAMQYYREARRPLSGQALQDALFVCEARSQYDGPVREVGVPMMASGGNVYLDLVNDCWQAIEINGFGWRVLSDPPVKFRRSRGMLPLPVPASGNISELRRFVNAGSDQNRTLMVAWLVAAMCPSGPYPILILQGEQGTAKSTVARVLRFLVDPSTAPLRSASRDIRDLMITATNSQVISYDNLSGIPHWLADALCRLSTGGGFATRALNTDNDEILF